MCFLVYYLIAEDTSEPTITRRKTFTKTLIDTTKIYLKVARWSSRNKKQISIKDWSEIVAKELCDEWIQRNVYPMHENNVARKIKCDYEFQNHE